MRRQRGDVGLINQRYSLVLFGNGQHLEIHPWQAVEPMTVRLDKVAWDVNTWYRMKLRVENRPDGTTLVQGKVWKRESTRTCEVDDREGGQDRTQERLAGHLCGRHLGRDVRQL
jgi:hypothetical protein